MASIQQVRADLLRLDQQLGDEFPDHPSVRELHEEIHRFVETIRADDPLPLRIEHVQELHAKIWKVLDLVAELST